MTQRDRDRLVVLRKARKKLITQKQAAEELQLTERQVRRLLARRKEVGDKAVVHGLRGRASNRKLSDEVREQAARILSGEVYGGSDPPSPASIWRANTASAWAAKPCPRS